MSIRYTLASKDGDIVPCARCDSEAPTVTLEDARLCKFCNETEIGLVLDARQSLQPESSLIVRSMAQIANILYWTESRYVEREEVK